MKKGQVSIGTLIMLFVAVIVAVALMTGGIFSNVGQMTNTFTATNTSVTLGNNLVAVPIGTGIQAFPGTVTVVNATSGATVTATNYTITNYVVRNGQLVATITPATGAVYVNQSVKVQGVYEMFGYDTNGGNRTIISLIPIFAALALAVIVLVPSIRERLFDF